MADEVAIVVGPAYTPEIEKVLWVLDHHRVAYRVAPYVPIVGKPLWRWRLREWRPGMVMPYYMRGAERLHGSRSIVMHVDRRGASPRLIPAAREAAIIGWEKKSYAIARLAHPLMLQALAGDVDALRERTPSWAPGPLRDALVLMSRARWRYVRRFWSTHGRGDPAILRQELRDALTRLRGELAGRSYVLEDFSYADICIAVVLGAITPPPDPFFPLGPHNRRCFTQPDLLDAFADLVEWRDRIYQEHRRPT
jgi:glutathione S-transferase